MTKIIPVILSGGAGSRLWPLSKQAAPKQLLPLITNQTMVQETAARFQGPEFADPVFVCNALHMQAIDKQMRQMNQTVGAFIVEPVARNTAPCAVIAACHALVQDDEALVLLVPADHHVKRPADFRAAIMRAVPAAQQGRLVTFGIEPDGPEIGYGYIARGKALYDGAYEVDAFREKPDLETAKSYLAAGGFAWNGGIFLFAPETFIQESEAHAGDIARQAKKAYAAVKPEGNVYYLDKDLFGLCPSESIDYAVMEHTEKAAVVPCDIGWNDIGSFTALQAARAEINSDDQGNAVSSNVMLESVSNSLVQTDSLPISVIGLSDVAVIVHEGEVMVVSLDQAQSVKNIVNRLKETGDTDRL